MSTAEWIRLIDWTCLALVTLAPLWAVTRLKGMGVVPAAAFVWIIGCLHHPAVKAFKFFEMGQYMQTLLVATGWLIALIYVGALFWVVQLLGVVWDVAQERRTGVERPDASFDMRGSWEDDEEYEDESSLRYYMRAYLRRLPTLHLAELIGLGLIAALTLSLIVIAWHPWK